MEFSLPELPEKDFFTMGEACQILQLPAHTLRYWEEKMSLRPARRSSGHRRFTRADLENALFIKEMLHRRKMTLAGARRALVEWRKGAPEALPAAPAASGAQGSALKLLREIREEIRQLARELR